MSGDRHLTAVGPDARKFLLMVVTGMVTWQCVIGPALQLFAVHIKMPLSWIGALNSIVPFSTALVLFTSSLVERFGPRRVMITAWSCRTAAVALVFLMPLAVERWGLRAGWIVVMAATGGYCLIRAVGMGGWFSWIHELIPASRRGAYFGIEQTLIQVTGVISALGLGLLLGAAPTTGRFLSLYGIGVAAGLVGVAMVFRTPGGGPALPAVAASSSWSMYGSVLRDRSFLRFLVLIVSSSASLMVALSASVLYLKKALELPDRTVMILAGCGALGAALTVRHWGRFADRVGSGRAIVLTLTAISLGALAWLALVPGAAWTPLLVPPVVIFHATFAAALHVVAARGVLAHVRDDARAAYTNLWFSISSGAQGLSAILVGQALERWGLWGFRGCFLVSGIGGLICVVFALRIHEPDYAPLPPLSAAMTPANLLRASARIFWISLGRENGDRSLQGDPRKSP